MEVAALWIALVGAVAAVSAAVFTFVQAKAATDTLADARAAEAGARDARDAAVAAQRESATAAGRIAEILEQQHEAATIAASKREDPWEVRPGSFRKNGKAALLALTGDREVTDVSLTWERQPRVLHLDPEPVPSTMKPGDAVEIYWMRVMGDASTFVVEVHWRWPDQEQMTVTRATLS